MMDRCEHIFRRRLHVRANMRWECIGCHYRTRRYDSIDARMERPIYTTMTVALRGYNTIKGGHLE